MAIVLATAAIVAGIAAASPDRADDPPAGAERAPDRRTPPPSAPDAGSHPPSSAGPTTEHPSAWNADVVDLVAFIQEERGLTFEHPVEVVLLSEEEYIAESGGQDDGSLGYYDGQRVVGRGTELTPALKGTLVHELTHALDDQHFDLFAIDTREGVTREEVIAFGGLVEGDAIRMEFAFDQMQIEEEGVDPEATEDPPLAEPGGDPGATGPGGTPGSGGTTTTVGSHGTAPRLDAAARPPRRAEYGTEIPSLRDAIDESPYFIGEQLLDMLVHDGGNAAVDAAFRDPPTTTEHVLDPRSYLDRNEPVAVDEPAPADAAGRPTPGRSAGALNLYLLLAAGLDPITALDAATGWGGESAVTYEGAGGRTCTDVAAVGDTDTDTAEIGDAFAAWAESGVAASATTSRRADGAHVLTACDIGGGDGDVATDPYDALVVALQRGGYAWNAMEYSGMDAHEAFEFGDCVVHEVSVETLVSPEETAEGESEIDAATASC